MMIIYQVKLASSRQAFFSTNSRKSQRIYKNSKMLFLSNYSHTIFHQDYVPHMQSAEKASSLCDTEMMCGLPSYQAMATKTTR